MKRAAEQRLRPMSMYQCALVVVFTALALLILAGGSIALGRTIIFYSYFGFSFPDSLLNFAYAVSAAWACAVVALATLRHYRYIVALAALAIAGCCAAGMALLFIGGLVPTQMLTIGEPITPVHGLPAVLVVALFVVINVLACYGAWRFVLRGL